MYEITREYIRHGKARSGKSLRKVRFIVAHDTGNSGSTARNNRNYFNNRQPSGSAHTFIDDKEILEIIPLIEKAWHVQYQKPIDNQMFGDDANDCAIGVELCYGGKIDFQEAYKRYVWYMAHLCGLFKLDPSKHIVAHATLDPERRSDPHNALNKYGITFEEFIEDVEKALHPKPQVKSEVTYNLPQGILKRGDGYNGGAEQERVKQLQRVLNAINFKCGAVDGIYGPQTEDAVRRFQSMYGGLVDDGIYGPNTRSFLLAELRN